MNAERTNCKLESPPV